MNRTQHTPGPWEARSRSLSDGSLIVSDKKNNELACVRRREDRSYSEEDRRAVANAVLMAAAPELLASLEEALTLVGHRAQCAQVAHSANECTCHRAEWSDLIERARGDA